MQKKDEIKSIFDRQLGRQGITRAPEGFKVVGEGAIKESEHKHQDQQPQELSLLHLRMNQQKRTTKKQNNQQSNYLTRSLKVSDREQQGIVLPRPAC